MAQNAPDVDPFPAPPRKVAPALLPADPRPRFAGTIPLAVPPARAHRVKSALDVSIFSRPSLIEIVGQARGTLKMDPHSLLKSYARKVRAHPFSDIHLTHGQALEITVSLVSAAESWNEFAANPHSPVNPATVSDYLATIIKAQRRIAALNVAPSLSRGLRSYAAVEYFAAITDTTPFAQRWDLLDGEGVTTSWYADGDGPPRKARLSDGESLLAFRLATWYFSHRQGDRWPWDSTKQLALSMGFSEQEAATIRQLQREAPNHSWDLELWFEVGVLDLDQRLFLQDLKNTPGWQAIFEDLYDTDGGRGSYGDELSGSP